MYCNDSNNSDHPIIRTSPYSSKNYIPSIRTPTFQIIILISKHLHLAELERVAKYLIAFDSFFGATVELPNVFQHTTGVFERLLDSYCHCGARMGVAKCVLAFDGLCGARTGVAKRVLAFNSLCRVRTGFRERLLAFDSLWTVLVIVTSNVYSVCV